MWFVAEYVGMFREVYYVNNTLTLWTFKYKIFLLQHHEKPSAMNSSAYVSFPREPAVKNILYTR